MSFEGETAIVTGATEGIGLATAELLARRGANLVLLARREERGREVVAELGSESVAFVAADVSEPGSADRAVALAQERFGGLDVLVNNAAIDHVRPILEVSRDEALELMSVNFLGALMMLQAAAKAMRGRGGSIVNVSSRAASIGLPSLAVYSATKGALEALTRAAAIELAPDSIRVNAVAPGLTETPLVRSWLDDQADPEGFRSQLLQGIPQRRFGAPEDVAAAIGFLASAESAHITGAVLPVDGGYTAQ